jgi:hypothetical protein
MAKKKFLIENDVQVWPITRADCVYHTSGNELLSSVVDGIIEDLLAEVERAKAAEKKNADKIATMEISLNNVIDSVFLDEDELNDLLNNIF